MSSGFLHLPGFHVHLPQVASHPLPPATLHRGQLAVGPTVGVSQPPVPALPPSADERSASAHQPLGYLTQSVRNLTQSSQSNAVLNVQHISYTSFLMYNTTDTYVNSKYTANFPKNFREAFTCAAITPGLFHRKCITTLPR